jgi:hypothetical protein
MGWIVGRRVLPAIACMAVLLVLSAAGAFAQGVFTPIPGSAPAASGPNSVNPSAAASDRNPSAYNPSAAPSAISTPNALNPSATPSTFAPQVSPPTGPTVTPRSMVSPRRIARPRDRAKRAVRRGERAPPPPAAAATPAPPREAVRRTDQRARAIMGSVCRGC